MKFDRQIRAQTKSAIWLPTASLLLGVALLGCAKGGGAKPPGSKVLQDGAVTIAPCAPGQDCESTFQIVSTKPPVVLSDLDKPDMRLVGFRVGIQDFLGYQLPALSMFLPQKADFAEILRCRVGSVPEIRDVDLGAASVEQEQAAYAQEDLWTKALEGGCILIIENFVGSEQEKQIAYDSWAPTGKYFYIGRACVARNRLYGVTDPKARNCSISVVTSNAQLNFENKLQGKEAEALKMVTLRRNEFEGLGVQMYYLSVRTNNSLLKCQLDEWNRQKRVAKKQALASIIAAGTQLAMSVAGGASGGMSSTTSNIGSGVQTFTSIAGSVWGADKEAMQNPLANALGQLFREAEDYPRSCGEATKAMQEGKILTDDLQNAHMQFAAALDAAALARKERLQREKL